MRGIWEKVSSSLLGEESTWGGSADEAGQVVGTGFFPEVYVRTSRIDRIKGWLDQTHILEIVLRK